jgi:hypothetical protein
MPGVPAAVQNPAGIVNLWRDRLRTVVVFTRAKLR